MATAAGEHAMSTKRRPGEVRDAIFLSFRGHSGDAKVAVIRKAMEQAIGEVPASSVRSYLRLNTPETFKCTGRGRDALVKKSL
jgi:site-specific DNA-methyltransferase (adenine-specific)